MDRLQVKKQTNRQTYTHIDTEQARQAGRRTDRWTEKLTGRSIDNRETNRYSADKRAADRQTIKHECGRKTRQIPGRQIFLVL